MAAVESLSARKPLRFWGWGYADEDLSAEEDQLIESLVQMLSPQGAVEVQPPRLDDFDLPPPRLAVPERFAAFHLYHGL